MTELQVHVDLGGSPVRAGTLYATVGRGSVSSTFVYDSSYLSAPTSYDLEPRLVRRAGQQYVPGLPGAFADCAPDRWGRNLIDKRRRAEQRTSGQRLPALTEVDYLLGVSDLTRQGNLRFAVGDGPFLTADTAVPKLVALPRLLASADKVVDAAAPDDLAAVKALLDAGSGSLGGARPKASVRGDDGELLIAKFPHAHDDWDVMAWELVTLDLARAAGIRVPAARLADVGGRNVLLLHRFDRGPRAQRLGYVSAMTVLEASDGDERDYVDIAEALVENGARVNEDLAELFRRVVLSVAVHNTDDHLRNHGFLRARGGWTLSPVFDVNPNPDLGRGRSTSVLGAVGADEVDALVDFATECRLTSKRRDEVVREVLAAVATWREVAVRHRIAAPEQNLFAEVLDTQISALARLAG